MAPTSVASGGCCPKCGADLNNSAAAEEEEVKFQVGQDTPPPLPPSVQVKFEVGPNPVRFEMGQASREPTPAPSIRLHQEEEEEEEDEGKKRRHLSEGKTTSGAGFAARQHWVTVAPRGSLEIRSPAKELAMRGRAGGGLTHNRSDSKLSVRPSAQPGGKALGGRRKKKLQASTQLNLAAEGQPEAAEKGGAASSGGGASLPRTLSTSVLRIKHRRSFWEKVIG